LTDRWVIPNAHLAQLIVSFGDDVDASGRDNKKKVSLRPLSFTYQSEDYMVYTAPTK